MKSAHFLEVNLHISCASDMSHLVSIANILVHLHLFLYQNYSSRTGVQRNQSKEELEDASI